MGWIKVIVWTGACVGLGVVLATWELGGHTALQHAQRGWKRASPQLERVREGAEDAVDRVRKRVSPSSEPVERHSSADRDAINHLVSKRPVR
jgi:hypothetical protein